MFNEISCTDVIIVAWPFYTFIWQIIYPKDDVVTIFFKTIKLCKLLKYNKNYKPALYSYASESK